MNDEHEHVLERHLVAGIGCWSEDGFVWPKAWATSETMTVVATPNELPVVDTDAVAFLAFIAEAIGARWAGFTDEVWTKESDQERPGVKVADMPGELRDIADLDPTVKTGIVCHGVDLDTGEVAVAVASQSIDDDGHMAWLYGISREVEGKKVEHLATVHHLLTKLANEQGRKVPTIRDVMRIADTLGWTMRRQKL